MAYAVVTGGNRGIGRAIAQGLVKAGHDVAILVRDTDHGTQVADEIGAHCLYADLSDPQVIPGEVADSDILINNAGVLFDEPLFSRKARFDETLTVMCRAPYELIRAALPGMTAKGAGRIVNVSSGWGSFAEGLGGPGAYGIAKAALNALTVVAARGAGPGIAINAMCPGWVHTRMGGTSAPRTPEDGADTALWLALDAPGDLTGRFFRDRQEIPW